MVTVSSLGDVLRLITKAGGWKRTEVARMFGVHYNSVKCWYLGVTEPQDETHLRKWAELAEQAGMPEYTYDFLFDLKQAVKGMKAGADFNRLFRMDLDKLLPE